MLVTHSQSTFIRSCTFLKYDLCSIETFVGCGRYDFDVDLFIKDVRELWQSCRTQSNYFADHLQDIEDLSLFFETLVSSYFIPIKSCKSSSNPNITLNRSKNPIRASLISPLFKDKPFVSSSSCDPKSNHSNTNNSSNSH